MDPGPFLFPVWSFYAAPWLLGLGTALAARWIARRPWHEAAGIGIMTVPVWDTLWGILESFGPLLQGGFVLRPYTRYQLSGLYTYKFLADLGYLGLGFLVYASPTWTDFWSQTPNRLASSLVRVGFPMGRFLGGRGEGASLFAGLLLFPVLLLVTVGTNVLLSGFDSLRQSDETRLFANMTPYHALVISLAAGFGEELLYRGLIQTSLARRIPILLAITVQALFFGLAHSGYGTWIHVLLPTLFGLVVGLAAWRLGLWAAIALHFMVDLYAFGAAATANQAWLIPAINTLFLANLVLMFGWVAWWVWKRLQPRAHWNS